MRISDTVNLPVIKDDRPLITGFLGKPDSFFTFDKIGLMDRVIESSLDEFGFPCIEAIVVNPTTKKQVLVKAIIDTGAAYSLIKQHIVDALGLSLYKNVHQVNPKSSEIIESSNFLIDLLVDIHNNQGAAQYSPVRVGIIHSTDYPAEMIIGVELLTLAKMRFSYDGEKRRFILNTPFS